MTILAGHCHSMACRLLTALAALAAASCGDGGSAPPGLAAPAPTASPAPAPAPTPAPSAAVEVPRGYFALTTRRLSDAEKAELVGNPAISGMTSYVTWSDI